MPIYNVSYVFQRTLKLPSFLKPSRIFVSIMIGLLLYAHQDILVLIEGQCLYLRMRKTRQENLLRNLIWDESINHLYSCSTICKLVVWKEQSEYWAEQAYDEM